MKHDFMRTPLGVLMTEYTYLGDFFIGLGVRQAPVTKTFEAFVAELSLDFLEERGLNREQVRLHYEQFWARMEALKAVKTQTVQSVTVLPGHDKQGIAEAGGLTLRPGEIVSIVGPTGAGKSRLLADIECLAQADTPTGRRILVNGEIPGTAQRFALEHKLVAQLSQNMNFVMDLSVREFIIMHAESRMVEQVGATADQVIACANELAGERFAGSTALTQLSGGQSRALMIADTALLTLSPIVLIDEIENAGVDRKKALDLLVKRAKIVLISTHDPLLALMGQRRIIIRNGGIDRIMETNALEQKNLGVLEELDAKLMELRNGLRQGKALDFDIGKVLGMNLRKVKTG